ncbi:MAG: hypothetical protein QOG53_3079 [Frankiales bacterium]|jgi:hypothetical protein|nr:hypothetical protein [Frankiales bacterium]
MLSEHELRERLAGAAANIGDDDQRAPRAIRNAQRRRKQQRHRAGTGLAVAVSAVAIAGAVVITREGDHGVTPASAAVISCDPGRTVAHTPVVASSPYGTVVTITNTTGLSVRVLLGREFAVVPPGLSEGQYLLGSGEQAVQCVSDAGATPAVAMSVVPAT